MKSIIFTLIALIYASCAFARDGAPAIAESSSSVLAKMTSSISATTSKPGDPVTAEIIDPVSLRGAQMEGKVTRADHSVINFEIDTLRVGGKAYPVQSRILSVTSSKGNEGQDDLDQRIRIEGGGVIAYGVTTEIDEGAEVRLSVWRKK